MAEPFEHDTELLEEVIASGWRQQWAAAIAGLFSAGPIGLVASLATFRRLEGNWLAWGLIGVLAAPPLAYGQWLALRRLQANGERDSALEQITTQSVSEADRVARACAEAIRGGDGSDGIRNPTDGSELFCDRSYPTTVVITSRRFPPLPQPRRCGSFTLAAGTTAAQWLVSPAGSLLCQAVIANEWTWWGGDQASIDRAELYRRCTENLRLEARTDFTRTAQQLGRRDYCAEEKALLARDRILALP